MVDIGVSLPTRLGAHALTTDELLRIAETADALPQWDHLWVTDSVISLPFYDSAVLLAACAARTQRIRLGVACQASLGLRQPLVVAQQWANLDVLSAGRMTLVACPGEPSGATREKELRAFGMTHPEKVARMEENVDWLRTVSAGGPVSFSGQYFKIDDLELAPAFVQQPLPIWMAGNPPVTAPAARTRRVLGRVARLGDGWLTYAVTPAVLRARTDELSALLDEGGRQLDASFPVCVFLNVNVHPRQATAVEDALAAWSHQSTRNVSAEQLQEVSAIGSPAQAADTIGRLVEAGATAFIFELLSERRHEQLELITENLLPLIS